jgi:hypothetical protein
MVGARHSMDRVALRTESGRALPCHCAACCACRGSGEALCRGSRLAMVACQNMYNINTERP